MARELAALPLARALSLERSCAPVYSFWACFFELALSLTSFFIVPYLAAAAGLSR